MIFSPLIDAVTYPVVFLGWVVDSPWGSVSILYLILSHDHFLPNIRCVQPVNETDLTHPPLIEYFVKPTCFQM